MIDRII